MRYEYWALKVSNYYKDRTAIRPTLYVTRKEARSMRQKLLWLDSFSGVKVKVIKVKITECSQDAEKV